MTAMRLLLRYILCELVKKGGLILLTPYEDSWSSLTDECDRSQRRYSLMPTVGMSRRNEKAEDRRTKEQKELFSKAEGSVTR
jgi:hypothetical protein